MDSTKDLDHILVEKVKKGEVRAFEVLVIKYQGRVHRLLSRLVRESDEIEDILQDVFLKVYRALPGFRGESLFYTWLYRIAVNTAKNHLSLRSRLPGGYASDNDMSSLADEGLLDVETPENVMISREIARTVHNVIEKLPGELREALVLRELDGMSYDEIAQVMSCPVGTVRSRIFRAREAVANKLQPIFRASRGRRW